MGSVSLSLAAITGALSVLNPCGFPLLPALKNTLRWMIGEEQITHLGREYYEENDD